MLANTVEVQVGGRCAWRTSRVEFVQWLRPNNLDLFKEILPSCGPAAILSRLALVVAPRSEDLAMPREGWTGSCASGARPVRRDVSEAGLGPIAETEAWGGVA